jgi:hypothetical protein
MKITLNTRIVPENRREEIESLVQGNSSDPRIAWVESPSPYAVVDVQVEEAGAAPSRSGALEARIHAALANPIPTGGVPV